MRPVWYSFQLLNKREKSKFGVLLFSRLLAQLLDLLGIVSVGWLTGQFLRGSQEEEVSLGSVQIVVSVGDPTHLVAIVLGIATVFVAKSGLSTWLLWKTTRLVAQIEARNAESLIQHIFGGGLSRLQKYSRGDQQWIANQSCQAAFSSMLTSGSTIVSESSLFIIVLITFAIADPFATALVSIYFLALALGFQIAVSTKIREIGKRLAASSVEVNNRIVDLSQAFKEIEVMSRTQYFVDGISAPRKQLALDRANHRFMLGVPRFFIEGALLIGVATFSIWQFLGGGGAVSPEFAGILLAGGFRLMVSIVPLQNALTDIRANAPQAARAQDIINATLSIEPSEALPEPSKTPPEEGLPPIRGGVDVFVENATFSHNKEGPPALRNLSMRIKAGEFVAIIGPSGAGKTTLVDLILGLRTPDSGTVSVAGKPPRDFIQEHPAKVGYVPQRPGLMGGSLRENILLGHEGEQVQEADIIRALSASGLWNHVKKLPEKLSGSVSAGTELMSGGQVQRLGLARALLARPWMLVLDEATSSLDAETEYAISKTIEKLKGNCTVIVVAHRLSTIQNADKIFVIRGGRVTDAGTFTELLSRNELVRRYVELLSFQRAFNDEF